jgi:hypothetical protein
LISVISLPRSWHSPVRRSFDNNQPY